MSKTRAAARTWGFWISIGIAALGTVQTGLEQLNTTISPLWFGISNMIVGVILAMLRVAAAVPPPTDEDGEDSGV